MWDAFHFIHYVQLIGTSALLFAGGRPLARTLLIMPRNRRVPFARSLVRPTYLTPPVRGSIMQILPGERLRYVRVD